MEVYLRQGLISDSKVLDIRQVDVRAAFVPLLVPSPTKRIILGLAGQGP